MKGKIFKSSYQEHFLELRQRLLKVIIFFIAAFVVSYCYKEQICAILIKPLLLLKTDGAKIIYTAITEAFFSYLNLAFCCAWLSTMPFLCYQIYCFIAPALDANELTVARILMLLAPFLFLLACVFVYFVVMPNAWRFFLSFETIAAEPMLFEARIGQYLEFVIKLMMAFGVAFELPVVLIILFLLKILTLQGMIKTRRISIVINFIIAGIITPPDVLSQLMLAIPMCMLYEMTIMICRKLQQTR